MNEALSRMPEWCQELSKAMKDKKPKQVSPEKKAIIDYLKKCIRELEED